MGRYHHTTTRGSINDRKTTSHRDSTTSRHGIPDHPPSRRRPFKETSARLTLAPWVPLPSRPPLSGR
ncbi:hypothetical protein ACRE_080360 [Hapsidospora chrysogenum ATCC 11550]|uniref:Uncharacterized protein n=1 Tax=Hapsidospora chrysogenum (strain ATCC 11550 / CBS 779.69 / DSM 880 / IAM 14645 / JCM 23072 / IMI 49137) TaxID=857340 RepID=A0A086SVX0_HAPC1|nr:hypothetical protein ACRE_080360 [Hapsidospora chrysogenum ATCC 11550]